MAGNPFGNKGGATATATKPTTATKTSGGLDTANGNDEPTPVASVGAGGDPFALPSGGGSDYRFAEFLGELLLIRPDEADAMATKVSKGELQEFVRMDVIRLDNDNERCDDVISFHQAIVRDLKKVLRGPNEWILGRLAQGEEKKGNPPYILEKPTAEDITRAKAVMKELGLL